MTLRDNKPTDDEIVDLLRTSLQALPNTAANDEAPPDVIDGAKWIFDWSNMDSNLAELTFDSLVRPELAGIRSMGSLRELTFVSGEYTLEMQIEVGPQSATVSGTIDPTVSASVELLSGGEVFSGPVDASGAFLIQGVPAGTVLVFIEMPARKIRLSSFEI